MADLAAALAETSSPAMSLRAVVESAASATESSRPDVNSIIAHVKQYQIRELVGEGGMGWVYRAFDPVLEREVALKVMKPHVPTEERRRFRQEALYGARFCHPGMVRVYDLVGVPGQGISWFAMEYLPGRDMEDVLRRARRRGKSIPMRLIADVFRQTLGALHYAHQCGVVHRDVKPANMFVTRDPNTRFVTTKLLDFGVALDRSVAERDGSDLETRLVGDPWYMPPEQAMLGRTVDARADVYAAGMALYEIVTGYHPFEDVGEGSSQDLLLAHRDRTPVPLSNHLPNETPVTVACGLDVVFEKACAKDPDARFETAADMASALAEVFAGF